MFSDEAVTGWPGAGLASAATGPAASPVCATSEKVWTEPTSWTPLAPKAPGRNCTATVPVWLVGKPVTV